MIEKTALHDIRSASVFFPSSFKHDRSPAMQDDMLFIGEWSSMPFDPLVWGLGNGKPIILTESSDIKWRIGRIKAMAKVPGYIPHLGLRPPTWEHGLPLALPYPVFCGFCEDIVWLRAYSIFDIV